MPDAPNPPSSAANDAGPDCRRLGLRCVDCLPFKQWCDLCVETHGHRVTPPATSATPAGRGFGLLRQSTPESDLTPITGGLDLDTDVVDGPDTPNAGDADA